MTELPFPINHIHSDFPALIYGERSWNFRAYYNIVNDTALKLKDLSIKHKERIAIYTPKTIEYIVLLMALWKIGAIAAPISTRLALSQLREYNNKIAASMWIISKEQKDFPDKYHKVYIEDLVDLDNYNYCDITKTFIKQQQEATIVFSSGSSGAAKAILHTYGNHYYNACGSEQNISLAPGDCWLLSLPLYHVGGIAIVMRAALSGAAIALPCKDDSLEESLQKLKISHLSLVTTQLRRLLEVPSVIETLTQLKAVLLGGSKISEYLVKKARRYKIPIYTSYGSTEMASQIATSGLIGPANQGKILPYCKVKIAADGEILVAGKTLFKGYIEGTNVHFTCDKDRWFATNDLGKITDEQKLEVYGRKDQMIISGGENIYPCEIEQKLGEIPGILEVIVVAIDDRDYGQRPVAFICTEREWQPQIWEEYLRRHLEGFKVPKFFLPWPEDIKTQGIKVDRRYLTILANKELRVLSE